MARRRQRKQLDGFLTAVPWWVFAAGAAGIGGILVAASTGRVRNRERAAGVLPSLLGLLDDWERYGPFDIIVAEHGGLRTSEALQRGLAAGGASGASTLVSTPHGRGAALDLWPASFPRYVNGPWENVPPYVKEQFAAIGAFAKARGFEWGGDWRSEKFPNGDQPHIQMAQWARLPFPPVTRGTA